MLRRFLLIEDDKNGLQRAIRCAPNNQTFFAYTQKDFTLFWVKTYDEFVDWINTNGLPDICAFDHDLSPDSYDLYHKHNGYKDSDINYEEYKFKTGYDCAKYLVDYCIDNNKKLTSEVYSYSMNTKGRENILGLLNNFKQHQLL